MYVLGRVVFQPRLPIETREIDFGNTLSGLFAGQEGFQIRLVSTGLRRRGDFPR